MSQQVAVVTGVRGVATRMWRRAGRDPRPGLADDWPEGWSWRQRSCPLGRAIQPGEVADAVAFLARAGGVPEDREADGLVGAYSVADNLVLDRYSDPEFARFGVRNLKAVDALADGIPFRKAT